MRSAPWEHINHYRSNAHNGYESGPEDDFGLFFIPVTDAVSLKVLAGSGTDEIPWEHVSVSLPYRCPSWGEMSMVKDLFWGEDELVVQYHPPKSVYVNRHPYVLHLWKPIGVEIPMPPIECV